MSFDLTLKLRRISTKFDALISIRESIMTRMALIINNHCELYDYELATLVDEGKIGGKALSMPQRSMIASLRTGRRVKENVMINEVASLIRRAVTEEPLTESQVFWIIHNVQQVVFTADYSSYDAGIKQDMKKGNYEAEMARQRSMILQRVHTVLNHMSRALVVVVNDMRKLKVFSADRDLNAIQNHLMEVPFSKEPEPEVDGTTLIRTLLQTLQIE